VVAYYYYSGYPHEDLVGVIYTSFVSLPPQLSPPPNLFYSYAID